MASSSSTVPQDRVFINFRGKEVRDNFVAELDKALKADGINSFIDGDDGVGRDINDLFKRIEESRVALAVFSSRYTESKWCLDELVRIKERVEEGKLVVIPIFYKLEPSMVKDLEGEFGERFWKLGKSDLITAQKWKEALKFVAQRRGLIYDSNSNERDFIGQICKEVKKTLGDIADMTCMSDSVERGPSMNISQGFSNNASGGLSSDCVMINARDLAIQLSENEIHWIWLSAGETPNDTDVEVAKLIQTHWLEITGRYDTWDLRRGTLYKVVFLVKLEDSASGWDKPLNMKLTLPTGQNYETEVNPREYWRGRWLEIPAGVFVMSSEISPRIEFSMFDHNTENCKKGLLVKGVAICPTTINSCPIQ